jgi:hypothetical protein
VTVVTAGSAFTILVFVLMAVAFFLHALRKRRESPTRDWVRKQPVLFTTRAAILVHARGLEGNGWGALKGAGWPQLVVHLGGIEATIGAFDGLVSGNTMLTDGASMRLDRLSVFPLVAGSHDCIRLTGSDGIGSREWRVSPRSTSIDELWAQLVAAGVSPTAQSSVIQTG